MRLQFLLAHLRRQRGGGLPARSSSRCCLLGAGELGAAGHQLQGLVVQRAEQQVLEAVPELVAGGLGIHEGVQVSRESVSGFCTFLANCRMTAGSSRSRRWETLAMSRWFSMTAAGIWVAAASRSRRLAARGASSQLTCSVIAVAVGFAHVVEQQRQVEDEGPLHLLEQRGIGGCRGGFGLPDAVQLLEAHQGVLVGGVLVVELVLHQAGELAELGQVFAQQIRPRASRAGWAPRCRAG